MVNLFLYSLIALIPLTKSQGSVGTLTTAQKQYLLDMHNDIRNRAGSGTYESKHSRMPQAMNMNELLWDDGLAQLATDYSELCQFYHSNSNTDGLMKYDSITSFELPNVTQFSLKPIGENLAWSSLTPVTFNGTDGIEAGVQGWIDEGQEYDYGTISHPMFPKPTDETCTGITCDQFTQMIWASTRYIGCGYSDCDGVQGSSYAMNLVCQYYPAGNRMNSYPYESGSICGNCDGDRTHDCRWGYYIGLCAGGVDSSFNIDGTTDVDICDNGLGQALPNAVCPTTAAPTTSEPTSAQPTTANPTTNAPTTASPTTSNPTTPNPTTPSPTTPSPTTPQPTTESPTTSEPTTATPTTSEPTTTEPTTANPTTLSPTTPRPTTPSPTTPSPTTPSPTTPNPTTPSPTTPSPTTPSPTTPSPTTPSPITPSPTTPEPTTAAPTTMEPTTNRPTTSEPTTAVDQEPDTTQGESTTADVDTTSTTNDAQQCPGLDLGIVLFYTFNFDRIQRRCDFCLFEEQSPKERGNKIQRGCQAIGDFLNNVADEYSNCMLNICDYECTLDRLTIAEGADEQEICGCNTFECKPVAASANGYKLWSAIAISLGTLFSFIFEML